ncbi:hypothetical protein [Massilia pseudoviolaceinigra]|uniref:hypothetical protein n=1 Tax=Massilia pseudoviolaceinigra TaxID=3057165 RepID=UPI0027969313|nr:hypothetical protein [Massilia sp. CCM 9206]MDQ1923882.1 hypothetical protein [Massilia sp. CCM 9206]
MTIPSFQSKWHSGNHIKPRIYVLEVRKRDTPDEPAIAWFLVEREVTIVRDRDNAIHSASIQISFERIESRSARMAGVSFFAGSYSRGFEGEPRVSLTSGDMGKGTVFLDPPELRGQRIGTYLMNEIVMWAQQWPAATVNAIELLAGQADDGNKARRNRFYERFGLEFVYRDTEQREGLSRPMRVDALTPVETWKENVLERDIRDYIGELRSHLNSVNVDISRQEQTIKSLRSEIERAQARPLRWALRRTLWGLYALAGPLIVILIIAAAIWSFVKT